MFAFDSDLLRLFLQFYVDCSVIKSHIVLIFGDYKTFNNKTNDSLLVIILTI